MSLGYRRIPWSRRSMNFERKTDRFDYNKTSSKENIKKGKVKAQIEERSL